MIAGIQYGLYLGLYSSRVKAHIFKPVIRKSAEWFHARNLIENHTNFLKVFKSNILAMIYNKH